MGVGHDRRTGAAGPDRRLPPVPPHHADKLAELARARKKNAIVEVVHIPGINHLLVPATTGEVQEYQALTEKKVSEQVSVTIADWLKKIG